MIRQADIPPVHPGEPIGKSLLDLILKAANGGRVVAGDGKTGATMMGSRVGFSDISIPKANDARILIQVDSQNVSDLVDGLYRCRVYMQPFIAFNHSSGDDQFNESDDANSSGDGPQPYPNASLCYVFNMAEFGQTGHAITDDITTFAWPLGYSDDGVLVLGIPNAFSETEDDDGFWAIVNSSALKSGCEARWDYGLTEVTGNWTNEDKAQVIPDGLVVTGTNTIENPNSDDGIGSMGNGDTVSSTEFDNGLKLQPIPNGAVVWVRKDKRCLGGVGIAPIYLFSAWNKKKICPS